MYYNLGHWMRNKSDVLSQEDIQKINRLYQNSLDLNAQNHKTWHRYAMLNLEVAESVTPDEHQQNLRIKHLITAIRGFIKSVALGCSSQYGSKYILQDSLRLLTIIFNYGKDKDVSQKHHSYLTSTKRPAPR